MWILVLELISAPLVDYPYAPGGDIARFATLTECMIKANEMRPLIEAKGVPPFTLSCKPV